MTQENREKIRKKIKDDLTVIEREINDLNETSKAVAPDCTLDDIGRTEAMNDVMVNTKILKQAEIKYYQLKNALEQVDDESFGRCIVCDELINVERLMVRPESIRCIECASANL